MAGLEALLAQQLTEERAAHAATRRAYEALVEQMASLKREGFGQPVGLPDRPAAPDPLSAGIVAAIRSRADTDAEIAHLRGVAETMLALGEPEETIVQAILEGEAVEV